MDKSNKPKTHQQKIKKPPEEITFEIIKGIAEAEELLNAIGDGLSIIDRTFNILYQNQAEKDMMGDHVGEKCYKAYAKKQGICGGCPVALTFKDGKVHTLQRELQADEGTRYAEITASPLKDSKGNIIAGIEVVRDITERKGMEDALRANEQRYRNVYNTAPLAFVLWDRQTRVTDWNKRAEQLFGWTREEIVGKNFFDYIIPETARIHVHEIVKLLLEGKLPSYSINENITKSGRIIVCEWNNSIIRDSSGNVVGVISLGLDITERRQTEESLRLSEEKFRHLIDQAADLIAIIDLQGDFLDLNRRFEEESGWSRKEMIGRNIFRSGIVTEESVRNITFYLNQMSQGKEIPIFEIEGVRKDGGIVPYEIRATTIEKDDKTVIIQAILRNITERKQVEAALKASQARFSKFFHSSPIPIALTRLRDNQLLDVNQAWVGCTGFQREEVIGKSPFDLNLFVNPESRKQSINELQARGRISAHEFQLRKKSGEITNLLFSAELIELEDEPLMLSMAMDITDRKRAQEALQESEERYRRLFNEALDGMALADTNTGLLVDCNQALADLVGRNRSELIGQHQAILHPPSGDSSGFSPTFKEHLTDKEGRVLETQVLTKKGEIREVEIKANFLYLQGKKMLQGIFRDITEQKKTKEDIQKRIEELEDFYNMAVSRELRMIELKEQIKELQEELAKYKKQ